MDTNPLDMLKDVNWADWVKEKMSAISEEEKARLRQELMNALDEIDKVMEEQRRNSRPTHDMMHTRFMTQQ